ncbi:hypothetical protein [Xanthomonas graminis]|jgi:hypothetical protein|uniref:Uncharacterized protein n=2 Tax=Xanthomonas translucens group TaxID=3390202 RepID=A0A1M4L405_9XANT|nr:hypothetical protein [Xanthomonas translucens]EKU24562.1 hypothetical protein XTG29_02556 [Xanthomonas translucens pv. graminis ART-Xtg29]OAX58655.1 hypothetical protein A6R72_04325 [Xanthomonas translucens pv. graminis]UKE55808.1 hypothetical protein KFS84_09030 [Xanthomonas translucens pv. graminis]WIH13839.1 hypothetical protein KM563_09785 [Xanthomonas translucens pv. graminis]WIH17598.1 hypothetical protein KM433_10340 [Xanthomonas translucens pv. graminis]
MSRPHDTQERYPRKHDDAGRPHAHPGSPWAWIVVIALVLVASGWGLGRDRADQITSTAPTPATPASDPPRAP